MFNALSFLQTGWPIFEKKKKQKDDLQRVRKRSLTKVVPYMVQGSSEAMYCLSICLLVDNFSQNLYIRLFLH